MVLPSGEGNERLGVDGGLALVGAGEAAVPVTLIASFWPKVQWLPKVQM